LVGYAEIPLFQGPYTCIYQPFALGTLAVLAYYEAKINTRLRNFFGYILFFFSTLLVLVVRVPFIQKLHFPLLIDLLHKF
jgi:hypothetical protein